MKRARCLSLILFAFFAATALAQAPAAPVSATPDAAGPSTQTTASLPADPAALLQLAADANGLSAPGLKPWHIRATWKTVDAKGHPKGEGTWEEWWSGENKFKIQFTPSGAQPGPQTMWGTDHGWFTSAGSEPVPAIDTLLEQLITRPVDFPDPAPPAHVLVDRATLKVGGVTLDCVIQSLVSKETKPFRTYLLSGAWVPDINRYCFTGHTPAMRVETRIGTTILFNSLVQFQGKYLAQAMRVIESNGDNTDIAADAVEVMATPNDADFTPSAEITLAPADMTLPEAIDLAGLNRIGGQNPMYPAIALAARVKGVVVMRQHILRNGKVAEVKVISGPPMLQTAAQQAVESWVYRPFLLNGQPVEVESVTAVSFDLQ